MNLIESLVDNKNFEWCSECGEEVELLKTLLVQTCPSCGALIRNCTYCQHDLGRECNMSCSYERT